MGTEFADYSAYHAELVILITTDFADQKVEFELELLERREAAIHRQGHEKRSLATSQQYLRSHSLSPGSISAPDMSADAGGPCAVIRPDWSR